MKIIDVSQFQGNIDYDRLQGNVDGVIARAGYGVNGTIDPYFRRNAEECNRRGIPLGSYYFLYSYNKDGALREANNFLNIVKDYKMDLPLACDYEEASASYGQKHGAVITKPLVSSIIRTFSQAIESAGYYTLVYSNPSYISKYLEADILQHFGLWLAEWPKTVNDVKKPPRSCQMWQWGGSSVPGITCSVDTNESYVDFVEVIKKAKLNHLPEEKQKEWYEDAMQWALDNGIISEERPLDNATRAEVVQMFYNLMRQNNGR